jgi:hypothetical protein
MINPNAVLDPLSAAIEPSNDMIVLPFHHAYRNNFGMIPVRTQDDFMLVSPSHYDPERYPPGSRIQQVRRSPFWPLPQRWRAFHLAVGTSGISGQNAVAFECPQMW